MLTSQTENYTSVTTDIMEQFARQASSAQRQRALANLKRGIWIYFLLLIFEGGLRKWILPGLATPLLLIRDPIAIWMLAYGYLHGFFRGSPFITYMYLITAVAFVFTLLTGHGNLFVALYGARVLVIHFPLVFLIAQVFTHKDLIQIGKALLITAILQTFIATLQFYSPQSAWINKGLGGEEVKGFSGGLGYFRPPGTFSFTNGLSSYYSLIAPFVFYFWLAGGKLIKKWLLIAGTIALIIAIPISISRTLFYQVGLTAVFTILISLQKPKLVGPTIGATIGAIAIVLLLSNLSFFQTGIAAFTNRFVSATAQSSQASTVETSQIATSLVDRFFAGLLDAITGSSNYPFFGLGLGFGTNAGTQFLTGKIGFSISEGEWGRIIGEMGILLGLLFIIIRVIIATNTLIQSFKAIRFNNYLPWLLASFTFTIFVQGQWAQPTALGFSVLGMGFNLAALRSKS